MKCHRCTRSASSATLAPGAALALAAILALGCSGQTETDQQRRHGNPRPVEPATAGTAGRQSTAAGAGAGGRQAPAAGASNADAHEGGASAALARGTAGAAAGSSSAGAAGSNTAGATGSNTAGAAGSSGAGAGPATLTNQQLLNELQGRWEIAFGSDAPRLEGCRAAWAGLRGYLEIGSVYCPAASTWCNGATYEGQGMYADFAKLGLRPNDTASILLNGFPELWSDGWNKESIDQLKLNLEAGVVTGTGVATVRRKCAGQDDLVYELPVTLGSDRTRPLLAFAPVEGLAPYAVSWGDLRFNFSEVVNLPASDLDYSRVVALVDAEDPTKLADVAHAPSMWPGVRFTNPSDVVGSRQKLLLKTSAFDASGNPLTVDPTPIPIVDDSVLSDVFEFDTFEPRGLVGQARYVPPGSGNAPCESGGCVVIGPVSPCQAGEESTFFSLRLRTADHVSIRIRSAIYADVASYADFTAVALDSLDYISQDLLWGATLTPSPAPNAPLSYFSGFRDQTIVTQSQQARGIALLFRCPEGRSAARFAWIVERLELVHDGMF